MIKFTTGLRGLLAGDHWLRTGLIGLSLIACALALRAPGLERMFWNLDEASTTTMAEVVRDGGVLYRDAADNRTPLLPYLKAVIFAVTGDWNIHGAHVVLAGMLGLIATWLWRLSRSAGSPRTGVWAALFFTFLSFDYLTVVDTMSAHTGWFLIFFSTLGMWSFVVALRDGSTWRAGLAGILFALAALAKQPGLLDWGACLVLCALAAWAEPARWRHFIRLVAGLIAGFASILVLTWWYFHINDAWDDFMRYAWNYNTQLYVPEVPTLERLFGIRIPFVLAWKHTPYAFLLGGIGAVWLMLIALRALPRRGQPLPLMPWLILGWTASGLASTMLSGRDFSHYSIQVLPGLSLACAWVSNRVWQAVATRRPAFRRLFRGVLVAGLLTLVVTAAQRSASLNSTESVSLDVARMVQKHTTPDERIFIWGYEPEIHAYAQRLPNTRFFNAVILTGLIPWTNIDPLTDTTYAIVPGAWDDFWHDFERSPAAMIVDTYGNRGFLKYPLSRQERLWLEIENHYVEVCTHQAPGIGYRLFRRSADLRPLPADIPISPDIILESPGKSGPGSLRVAARAPTGTEALTLLVDGQPYRRVLCPPGDGPQVSFFVKPPALGDVTLQVVAEGTRILASAMHTVIVTADGLPSSAQGPAITLAGRELRPTEAEAFGGQSIQPWPGRTDYWAAHAPSRLVYRRPADLAQIEFSFSMRQDAYNGSQPQQTNGVDVHVFFEEDGSGQRTELYRRHLRPVINTADRGTITGQAMLQNMIQGTLTFLVTPGPMNDAAFDWFYWHELKGDHSPMRLIFRRENLPLKTMSADLGINLVSYQDRNVLLAHAPSSFTFGQTPGMSELSGEFGLLDSAWNGSKKSAGAIFEILQETSEGTTKALFTRTLNPAVEPADRGVQSFRIDIPYAAGADLRFVTRPAHVSDNSFNHTFWHGLKGADFSTTIPSPQGEVRSVASEAPNGMIIMGENDRDVLMAHIPSRLEFPIPPGARSLSGAIGMIERAYTDGGNTDGAEFIIEILSQDGRAIELFRRHLHPRDRIADRGAQSFEVPLPDKPDRRVILRTEPAASGRLDFGWSYWEGLRFNP